MTDGLDARTTDIAAPQKRAQRFVDVKIVPSHIAGHVRITSADGSIAMFAPIAFFEKKFLKGVLPPVAYFRAQVDGTSALEIVERYTPKDGESW